MLDLVLKDFGHKQVASVDLTVRSICVLRGRAVIGEERENAEVERDLLEGATYASLAPFFGARIVFNEEVYLENDEIGLLIPRSTLIRNGIIMPVGFFDPGYRGRPESMIKVGVVPVIIDKGARLAQLVVFKSDKILGKYKGIYQNENLKEVLK